MHPVEEIKIKEIKKTDCPFCGALNEQNRRFCLVCGFDIHGFITEAEEEQKKQKEKIRIKAALISKREEAIKKRVTNKKKSPVTQKKATTGEKASNSKMNIKQIFLYKELLDKPLALRKK